MRSLANVIFSTGMMQKVSWKNECTEELKQFIYENLGVDVNIYTSDPKQAKPLIGNHENTEIGEFIRDYLALDLVAIINELKSHDDDDAAAGGQQQWRGKPLAEAELKALAHQDHYHGDFKRSFATASELELEVKGKNWGY